MSPPAPPLTAAPFPRLHRLGALQFTNCHLEKSGLETYSCTDDMSVEACTRPMVDSVNSIAYSAYTTFFTHAESMCFYLQSEAFQRSTEQAVDSLHASARGTAEQLSALQTQTTTMIDDTRAIRIEQAAASEAAQELLAGQQAASASLRDLSSQQQEAFEKAESSLTKLGGESQAALAELKRGADELGSKQGLLLGGLDRILSVQGNVLGEFLDMKTLFFYTCAVLLALALTSAQRTMAARLPVFALLTLNFVLEKTIVACLLTLDAPTDNLHIWFSMCRRIVGACCAVVLVRSVLYHTDVGKKTLSALDDLKRMHREATDEMQLRLERLEKEAAAIRSRDATALAVQAATMRKQQRRGMSPRNRNSPPALCAGGRRALSPLVPSPTNRRQAKSPPMKLGAGRHSPLGGGAIDGQSVGLTTMPTEGMAGATAVTSATAIAKFTDRPPSVQSSVPSSKPPSPPQEQVGAPAVFTETAALASLASKGFLALDMSAAVLGTTPAARASKGRRRSSVGSTDTESNTPTRRSARIASRQRGVVEEAL
jgi:hypothetical protein